MRGEFREDLANVQHARVGAVAPNGLAVNLSYVGSATMVVRVRQAPGLASEVHT